MTLEDEKFPKEHKEWELSELSEEVLGEGGAMDIFEHSEEINKDEVDYINEKLDSELAEGLLISIGGMKWHPQLDLLELQLPKLHLSRKLRGRLASGIEVFEGSMMDDHGNQGY